MVAKKQDVAPAQDPRWEDVRIFLAAYRHKSLGAAAGRLDLDTSTVSRRLTVLESSLGIRLFERTREGLIATRGAERVLAAAEAMEAAHGRLTRDASDLEAEAEGVVRLSVAPGMADAFVAPALVRLRAKHPKIDIELDASVRPLDLTRHEADLAMRSTRPHGAELVVTKLGTAGWLAAGAPALVKRLGRLTSWNDAPWIAWDRDLASFPPARWLAQHAPKARIALRTSQFTSQLVAAESGLGVLLIPLPYMHTRTLRAVPYAEPLAPSAQAWPTDDLWLVGHRALRDVPRVAAVWTFLAEDMRRLARLG
ncbi:LysR family transcriptional regulator [Pendulispora rubella]|uniref:LysR family transcriptional regulator n=1 Tax=Pendulispora rubella TaxID=2741070 RepID=A0ABZ2L505_9BACT